MVLKLQVKFEVSERCSRSEQKCRGVKFNVYCRPIYFGRNKRVDDPFLMTRKDTNSTGHSRQPQFVLPRLSLRLRQWCNFFLFSFLPLPWAISELDGV